RLAGLRVLFSAAWRSERRCQQKNTSHRPWDGRRPVAVPLLVRPMTRCYGHLAVPSIQRETVMKVPRTGERAPERESTRILRDVQGTGRHVRLCKLPWPRLQYALLCPGCAEVQGPGFRHLYPGTLDVRAP